MNYCINIQTLNLLKEQYIHPSKIYYNTKEDAESNFGKLCIHLIKQNFKQKDIHIKNNFIEKCFSDGNFIIMLILNLNKGEC